jgi:hypothetical protein
MTKIDRMRNSIGTFEDLDTEPFMLREHTAAELVDYDRGFKAGLEGKEPDEDNSAAWQRGWTEAQE